MSEGPRCRLRGVESQTFELSRGPQKRLFRMSAMRQLQSSPKNLQAMTVPDSTRPLATSAFAQGVGQLPNAQV